MAVNDEKVVKFEQAITAYAEEQRNKIHKEVETFKAERLMAAEQQVLTESYQLIQHEHAEMNHELSREMSKKEMDARKDLLSHRLNIMNDVFGRATERLSAFTKSEAYSGFLTGSLKQILAKLPADGVEIQLSEQDKAYAKTLQSLLPAGCELKLVRNITIGGLRGLHAASGLMMDDTMDMRLELERDWFVRNSGLTVN